MTARSIPLFKYSKLRAAFAALALVVAVSGGTTAGFAVPDTLPTAGHLLDQPQSLVLPVSSKDRSANLPNANANPDSTSQGCGAASAPTGDGLPAAGHLTEDCPSKDDLAPPPGMQLDVSINGYKVGLIAGFNREADGGISSPRSELAQLGLKVAGVGPDTQKVLLSSIQTLNYTVDEPGQTIDIHVGNDAREPRHIDIVPPTERVEAQSDYGVVVNYSAYTAANTSLNATLPKFSGSSLNLDARAFSHYGVLQQSASLGTTTYSNYSATRLNTTYVYANQDRAESYSLGDIVSGSLNWTRPVRFGGAQVQRDFGLRPDLVTSPIVSMQGSAAVPSTLDVYLNGMKTFSQDVSEGPFEIARLPIISGQGTAQIVLTDTNGRQTTVEKPLYNSTQLLSPKLLDYALDLGFARRNFGTDSFNYDADPMLLGSMRYGVNNRLTAEAHVEGKHDLADGGLGVVFQAGAFGAFNFAAAASDYRGDVGYFAYGAWDWQNKNLLIHASSSRTFGNFTDLAAATALPDPLTGLNLAGVPKAQDQLIVSYGIPTYDMQVGGSLSHVVQADGTSTSPFGINVSKTFRKDISVFASAYLDLANTGNFGASVGLSMPLGKPSNDARPINFATQSTYDNTGASAQASAFKVMDSSYGSYGWRVSSQYQNGAQVAASGSYRAKPVIVSGALATNAGQLGGHAALDGSVVATKAGVFLGNPIADSFAVVNAGVPNIAVNYENRYVGQTDANGKLLLTQVRSFRPSSVSIDPQSLPLDSNVTETEKHIAPRGLSGVVVDFGVKKDSNAAIVVIKDAAGKDVPAGTEFTLPGQKDPFIMGYDAQVFVTGLGGLNKLSANIGGISCSVTFPFKPNPKAQSVIGPLTCG